MKKAVDFFKNIKYNSRKSKVPQFNILSAQLSEFVKCDDFALFLLPTNVTKKKKEGELSMAEKNVKYVIVKHYGVICKKSSYQKEVNLISWNGRKPVLDIRNFRISPDGEKCPLAGITVEKEDMAVLRDLLNHIDLERSNGQSQVE